MTTDIATFESDGQANISDVLRTVIRREAIAEGGVSKFARKAQVNPHRFYNQMNRGNGVLAELIVLCARNGYDEPLRIVAEACGHDVTPKPKFLRRAHPPTKPVRSYALDLHHACAGVTQTIEEALADECLDDHDRARVLSTIQTLRREMAELEDRIGGKR